VRFAVSIDGRRILEHIVQPAPGFFALFHDLPPGALLGDGPLAQVTIAAEADAGTSSVQAAVEQFDLQSEGRGLLGYGDGWHEAEFEPATGRLWRWTSARSVLRLHPVVGDVSISIDGESPLRYFDAAPTVTQTACGREVGRSRPARDFAWTVRIARAQLTACGGQVSIETDRTFVPDERVRNGDRRRLGLRVFGVRAASIRTAFR
jgi:hypothetical protein